MTNPKHYTCESLARALFTNKQQVIKDIHSWNEIISPYGAHIAYKPVIEAQGDELYLRFFIVYFFYQLADRAMKERFEPIIFEGRQTRLLALLEEMQKNTKRSYSLNAKHQIMLYIEIMMRRLAQGHTIQHTTSQAKLELATKTLMAGIQKLYGSALSDIEALELQEIFAVSNRGFVNQIFAGETVSAEATHYANLINEQIMLSLMTTREMKSSLKQQLANVIQCGLVRRKHKLNSAVAQEVSWAVHWDHMNVCLLLFPALIKAAHITGVQFFNTDYIRICLLLTPYVERYYRQNRWTCALVINGGVEQAEFLN